jgi:hypothetical protein
MKIANPPAKSNPQRLLRFYALGIEDQSRPSPAFAAIFAIVAAASYGSAGQIGSGQINFGFLPQPAIQADRRSGTPHARSD